MQTHNVRTLPSGEYSCTCGAVWDKDEGESCPVSESGSRVTQAHLLGLELALEGISNWPATSIHAAKNVISAMIDEAKAEPEQDREYEAENLRSELEKLNGAVEKFLRIYGMSVDGSTARKKAVFELSRAIGGDCGIKDFGEEWND